MIIIKEKNMAKKTYPNLCKVTHISIGFLFLFIAFNSADNLAAKVMKDDGFNNIGFYSMSLLYLAFAIGSFFSTANSQQNRSKVFTVYWSNLLLFQNREDIFAKNWLYRRMILFSSAINGWEVVFYGHHRVNMYRLVPQMRLKAFTSLFSA
eukprot:403370246